MFVNRELAHARYLAAVGDGVGGGGAPDPGATDDSITPDPALAAADPNAVVPAAEDGAPATPQTVSLDDFNALKTELEELKAAIPAAPAAAPPGPAAIAPTETLSPYMQAVKEAETAGKGLDQDWINDRAFTILSERSAQQQEQALTGQLTVAKQSYPAQLKAHFTAQNEAEPDAVVQDVMQTLDFFGLGAFALTPDGLRARQIAVDAALWRRDQRVRKNETAAKNGHVDPVTGASATGGAVPKEAQDFVRKWEQVHNGGKKATTEQIAQLKREHPYAMRVT